jgi:hypothetical protein
MRLAWKRVRRVRLKADATRAWCHHNIPELNLGSRLCFPTRHEAGRNASARSSHRHFNFAESYFEKTTNTLNALGLREPFQFMALNARWPG